MRRVVTFITCVIVSCVLGVGAVWGNSGVSQNQWAIRRTPEKFKEIVKRVLPQQRKADEIESNLDKYLESMSIEEKIGQLFIIALDVDSEGNGATILDSNMKEKIQRNHVGGVILFKNNIVDTQQTKVLIEALQASSQIPLFISVDEEGGKVSRVGSNEKINDTPFMAAGEIGKSGDTTLAYIQASRMGKVLKALGFNMNFAPCADIYNNPYNTVIGNRSFGTTSQIVTPMMIAFAKGLQDEGIVPVIKHYPGHGNTIEDSHDGLAYVHKSIEELEQEELIPFVEGVKAGIGGVMKGHLLVEAIDDQWPVSLSEKWGDYIRETMQNQQVLFVTDALNMGAIVNNYGEEEVVLRSFLAGNDILLMPTNIDEAESVLYKAYQVGKITEAQIDQSVRKILAKKVTQNILLIS